MKKKLLVIICTAFLVLGMMSSESAGLTITPSSELQWSGKFPKNPKADDIEDIVGSGDLFELYKQEVGDTADTGPFASSYQTTFYNTPTDPADATITFVSGSYITGDPLYLLVKDGAAHDPVWYIFNLNFLNGTAWDGIENLNLEGFWPSQGAISHVTIFGPTAVPEPTTLLLLGSGLVALCLVSRKFKR